MIQLFLVFGLLISNDFVSGDSNSSEQIEPSVEPRAVSPGDQSDPRAFFNHRPLQSQHFFPLNARPTLNNRPNPPNARPPLNNRPNPPNARPPLNNKPNPPNAHPPLNNRPNPPNAHPPLNNRPNLHQPHTTNLWQLLHMPHRPTSLANIVAQYSHLVSQHHLATLNQHRNPYFYYHAHPRPGQGSNQHPRPTPARPGQRSSPPPRPTPPSPTPPKRSPIPPVERPRSLRRFKKQYKKWWNSFHADLTSCGTQYGVNDGVNSVFRVIGGRISSIKSWPWMVSMYSTLINQPWCAGTLVAKDWVVTAAHCFDYVFSDPASWTLHFGKQNASGFAEYTYEQVRTIANLTLHPNYNSQSQAFAFDNDIALIKLHRPVEFNDYTAPVCMVRQSDHVTDHVTEDIECTITGYGIANKTNVLHEINLLHVAHVPLIDQKTCAGLQGYGDKVSKNMVCAGFDDGAVDTCKGDSGGPIQCKVGDKWHLVGVTSWGGKTYEGCAEPSEPGAYTDVSHYTEWIYTNIFNDYRANND